MKTLDELIEKVDGIAESQGKLLAALNELQAEQNIYVKKLGDKLDGITCREETYANFVELKGLLAAPRPKRKRAKK